MPRRKWSSPPCRHISGSARRSSASRLAYLSEAGYIAQRRVRTGSRYRVWLRMTRSGREAYRRHHAALVAIVNGG
ncbi:transcriptional regulator [Nocardioides convexus]|uniref:transcriptional regulator n=1 Tax=Nocardioides convexus TaxID=2712224 RepID=UPI00241838BD|nr:transcriptional regulator [Nocardioides convexus]